jgi:kumamolisin
LNKAILGIYCLSLAAGVSLSGQQVDQARGVPPNHLHGGGKVVTPQSGKENTEDIGIRPHTNYKIFVPPGKDGNGFADEEVRSDGTTGPESTTSPIAGYFAETPASLACLYHLVTPTTYCNPVTLSNSNDASGGSRAIAVVDAYHYPTALGDLTAYSRKFGLPLPTSSTFTVTWVGSRPATDSTCAMVNGWNCWATEAALDIEMAHAAAPHAHIYLVEAATSNFDDLFAALAKAVTLVQAAGGGEVSMSWGGSEFSTETTYDSRLNKSKVVMFASTGDQQGTQYPSVSPNVVAVGGTTIARSPSTLDFEKEMTWEDGGGGFSESEARPAFQGSISRLTSRRGIPDIAAVANPRTGVWVYDSFDNNYSGSLDAWNILGGTSVAAPLSAGIVNHAGAFSTSSAAELAKIYAATANATSYAADYRDITYGTCGFYDGWFAQKGWDPCTGFGAPTGQGGK